MDEGAADCLGGGSSSAKMTELSEFDWSKDFDFSRCIRRHHLSVHHGISVIPKIRALTNGSEDKIGQNFISRFGRQRSIGRPNGRDWRWPRPFLTWFLFCDEKEQPRPKGESGCVCASFDAGYGNASLLNKLDGYISTLRNEQFASKQKGSRAAGPEFPSTSWGKQCTGVWCGNNPTRVGWLVVVSRGCLELN